MASPNPSKNSPNSPKAGDASSSKNYRLTPDEIESLRQDKQQANKALKGRFLHLKPKEK